MYEYGTEAKTVLVHVLVHAYLSKLDTFALPCRGPRLSLRARNLVTLPIPQPQFPACPITPAPP